MEAQTTETIPGAWGTDGFKRHEMPSENFCCCFKLIPWEIISNKLVWQTFIPSTGPFYDPSTDTVRHFFMLTNSSLFPGMQSGWGKSQITGRKSSGEIHAFHLGVASRNCSHLKDGHWIEWFWYVGKEAGRDMGWESRSASFFLFAVQSLDKWLQVGLQPPCSHLVPSAYLSQTQ